MNRIHQRAMAGLLAVLLLFGLVLPAAQAAEETVMCITVDDAVELGLAAYLERNLAVAQEQGVSYVILELDTPGGRVDAAQDIKRVLYQCDIPTVAWVKDQALSAGAYIALCCDSIAMTPGSTLGDAEMLINGERADEKYMSPWREEFAAIAEDKGRNPEIAKAFVDRDMAIDGIVEAGKLLTLTPERAVELGMADIIVQNRAELLSWLEMADAELVYSDITASEKLMRTITHPNVAPVLLSVGILGLVLEFLTPGMGIFGLLGAASMGAYLIGHVLAGMASWIAVLLLVIGLLLCIIELFVPGIGIFAVCGIGCMVGSIALTTPDLETTIRYLVIVLVVFLVSIPLLWTLLRRSPLMDRLLVRQRLTTQEGYVAGRREAAGYVGQCGVAVTPLRPAGAVELEDGTRLDVVTRGDYIATGEAIQVIRKEGTWLVVERRRNDK